MSERRKHKSMEKLDSCYSVVQQSSTGMSAQEIARKLDIHRTTAHGYLNTLELMEKVYSEHGLWFARERQTTEPEKPKIPNDLRFYVEQGLITKKEIDVNAAAKTFLATLPKDSKEYLLTKLLIINFEEKLKTLKNMRQSSE